VISKRIRRNTKEFKGTGPERRLLLENEIEKYKKITNIIK
jgi:hypothetical protein